MDYQVTADSLQPFFAVTVKHGSCKVNAAVVKQTLWSLSKPILCYGYNFAKTQKSQFSAKLSQNVVVTMGR